MPTVRGDDVSQSFVSTPWFGAAAGAFLSGGVAWVRSFARRARPEDLNALESRLRERIDEVHETTQNVERRINELYRDLLGGQRK